MKRDDIRMPPQDGMNDFALHADAASVDDAHLSESPAHSLVEVFVDDNLDFLWLESVEVDGILDRDVMHTESI